MDRSRRYLEMLAHDIRSALGGCIGALEQIDPDKLDDATRRFRDGAYSSALAASRLFDGALDLEAIEHDDFALSFEPTALEPFLGETYRRWSAAAAAKGLTLDIHRDGALPTEIRVDRVRLARVLGNIIENAIKYTDTGAIKVKAGMTADGALRFTVADDGPGFSTEAMARLFEFKGRPDNSERPGTGIGLHIANLLAGQMGGQIGVDRGPTGAVVSITLPADIAADIAPAMAGIDDANGAGFGDDLPDLSHLNVLLAEDNATNQIVVTQMLDAMGARYSVASDGLEALRLFETQDFDLLLLDIEMPRLSGLEVIRSIRARADKRAATPIVALTAYAMRTHQEKIAEAGADGLIAKPIMGIGVLGEALLTYWRRRSDSVAPDTQPQSGTEEDPANLIDKSVFGALENSIGSAKMSELLDRVSIDLADVRDGLSKGMKSQSSKGVRSASHVLISVAGAIGAISTQQAAERLNHAANAEDWSQVRNRGEVCLTRIGELLTVIDQELMS